MGPWTLAYIHSPYWHMTIGKYASLIGHICSTGLLLQSTYRPHITLNTRKKRKDCNSHLPNYKHIYYMPTANMPLKCLYTNYFMCRCEKPVSIHISHELNLYNAITIYVSNKYALKCHTYAICASYLTCTDGNYVNIYATKVTAIKTVSCRKQYR